ncbi:MAG: hypothetical protein RIS73_261, partial [Bacteroidota bacterium]
MVANLAYLYILAGRTHTILSDIKAICNLTDTKNKLTTFKNQIPFAAAQINEWWDWT